LIVPCCVLALAALMVVSCGQQNLPTTPSLVGSAPAGQQPTVIEYFVTLVDDTPAPIGAADFRLLDENEPIPPKSPPSPWPPGPPPRAQPGVPVPIAPTEHHPRLRILVEEPVEHSGRPVGIYSCRDNRFTWYYEQKIHAETGVPIKITERQNFFDGRFVSKSTESISVPGNGTAIINTRWCSAYGIPHYAQTKYMGQDENGEAFTYSANWVRLLSP
jgi:hypothetical protein